MAGNNFAFRRLTDPLIVPVDITATQYAVPDNFFANASLGTLTSFYAVNPNPFWVRLMGSGLNGTGVFAPVTTTKGWLFPPGFAGVFSTQYPRYLSCLSVTFQGLPAGVGILEISYGGGA